MKMPISSNLLIKLYALPEEQRATLIKQMVEYKDRLVEYYVWELWDVTTMNSVWFEELVDKKIEERFSKTKEKEDER
jgi:hypothetical protein